MRAVVIKEPNGPAVVEQRERPAPGPGEVLIRTRACGVCHGDLEVQQGGFPFARYPIVPGHEIAGVVEEVGPAVTWPKPESRVGLSVIFWTCGRCEQCLSGNENLCPELTWTGVMQDGGYQEFVLAKADYVVPLPDSLDFTEAAPLMCAGLTVYSGLRHARFEPGDKVAVIGLGGLGHLAVLYARAMGGRVAVLSTGADKETEARELGAERFINTKLETASKALRAWDGGADIILATAPAVEPVNTAFPGLAPDGTMVVLGVGPGDIAVNPMDLIMGRRRLIGSPAGSRKELRDCLSFAAAHGIHPKVTRFPLEAAGDALAQMKAGHMSGRAVLVMG